MNKIYTKNIELRTSDFDYREQIKASAILDIFQDFPFMRTMPAGNTSKSVNAPSEETPTS